MRARGVQIFAITDHDTLAAFERLEPAPGLRVVTGIEINAAHEGGEVHILGYGLRTGPSPLTAVIEANREARRVRVGRIVTQLRDAGHDISFADVEAEAAPNATLGRPHVGKALIRKGIVSDIETAFRAFLRGGTAGYVPSTHITPHQAVDAILAAGGIPVLAHPGRLRDESIIGELAQRGLRGLEVFYPTHDANLRHHFREIAQRYGLVMTGGSDFHDIRYNKRGVGMEVAEEDIRRFLDLLAG
ncbi:MAG TPA: PHP domain-containing protein [Candidatus Rubrimentiphilum sp.]|nr:PHP domain-containing protein [Candidatus Rubrimentiphilum sp.]